MKKIGLALGGGGARGFAHIPILEVFDELGIRPDFIVGTSIGAILGALYASGHSAQAIANMLLPPPSRSIKDALQNKETLRLLALIDPHFSLRPRGLIKGERFLQFFYEQIEVSTFEALKIPFLVVATDFWNSQQVVFSSGNLLPAIRASMAIPYVFSPVILDGRVLVDGGLVNNVPHDLIPNEYEIRIAVDVMGTRSNPSDKIPSPLEAIGHSYQVMMDATAREKQKNNPVDLYLRPPLCDIEMLDFHKAQAIYHQALAIKKDFKRDLLKLLHATDDHL